MTQSIEQAESKLCFRLHELNKLTMINYMEI